MQYEYRTVESVFRRFQFTRETRARFGHLGSDIGWMDSMEELFDSEVGMLSSMGEQGWRFVSVVPRLFVVGPRFELTNTYVFERQVPAL